MKNSILSRLIDSILRLYQERAKIRFYIILNRLRGIESKSNFEIHFYFYIWVYNIKKKLNRCRIFTGLRNFGQKFEKTMGIKRLECTISYSLMAQAVLKLFIYFYENGLGCIISENSPTS